MKIKIKIPFIGNVNGRSMAFSHGETVELPRDAAADFIAAGYAESVEDKPAVKILNRPARTQKAVKK
jgi:hypothetical protein